MVDSSINSRHSIKLENLEIGYRSIRNRKKVIFGPLNLETGYAEMVGIIGRNGIGKSTLLRTIAGLQPQLTGKVYIDGCDSKITHVKEMARLVSFVSTESIHTQQIRVDELIALGRFPYTGWLGRLNHTDFQIISEAVENTGVAHLMHKLVQELSDGERQKVMIARALAQDTPILILDEPTAFLDLPTRYDILRILSDLALIHNKTILFTTHDLSIVLDVADKIWFMTDNTIFQGAPEDLLISKVFRKLFLNSPVEFDNKTSTFRLKRELSKEVSIFGEKKYRSLTKRAMERIGFKTFDEGTTDITLNIGEFKDAPFWQLKLKETVHHFTSVYDLVKYLKTTH